MVWSQGLHIRLEAENITTTFSTFQFVGIGRRFDQRAGIVEVVVDALDLEQTLMRYVNLYSMQLPQSTLRRRTPRQAMKDWHNSHPHLFIESPRNQAGREKFTLARICG